MYLKGFGHSLKSIGLFLSLLLALSLPIYSSEVMTEKEFLESLLTGLESIDNSLANVEQVSLTQEEKLIELQTELSQAKESLTTSSTLINQSLNQLETLETKYIDLNNQFTTTSIQLNEIESENFWLKIGIGSCVVISIGGLITALVFALQ